MRRVYKGFYIEPAGGGLGQSRDGYTLYHTVTGNAVATVPRISDARDEIDAIHTGINSYARAAGCDPSDLERRYGRFRYKLTRLR